MTLNEKQDKTSHYEHKALDLRPSTLNRTIFALAWPAIVENLMFSFVFFADTLIVGWLQNEHFLAAVALSSITMFWVNAPIQAMAIAANSLVSRAWGERDFETARRFTAHGLLLTFMLVGVIIVLGVPLSGQIIRLLGAEPETAAAGADYLRIIFFSSILGMPLMVSNAVIRAKGDTTTPMKITLLMNILNVAISLVLAFGLGPVPRLGLFGVAWGTLIARNIGGLLSLMTLFSGPRGISLRFDNFLHITRGVFHRIWHTAHPVIAERVINASSYAFFMWMVAGLGATALAGHQIALNVESLAFMPSFGMSIAVASIFGQAVGSGRHRMGELTVKRTIILSVSLMIMLAIVFVLFAPYIVRMFGATPEVLAQAGLALRIAALELPMFALSFIFMGALRGAGDTRSTLLVNTSSIIVLRLPATYLLAFVLDWGITGVWLATVLDWSGRSLGLWLVFRRGVWKTIHEKEKAKFRS